MFLIKPDNNAGWLFAPSCMNTSLYIKDNKIALLTLGLTDF